MFDLPANLDVAFSPDTAFCVVSAAHRFDLPPEAMLAIMFTEGGKPGMRKRNDNGSFDLGIMQINTIWLTPQSPLRDYLNEATLVNDPCTNIHAAGWILASNLRKSKNIWRAVGMYHSPGNDDLARGYMHRVNRRLPYARSVLQTQPTYDYYIRMFFNGSEVRHGHPAARPQQ